MPNSAPANPPASALCLFGAGAHGRVVASQVCRFLQRKVIFADNRTEVPGLEIVFQGIETIVAHEVVITIGDNAVRRNLHAQLQAPLSSALVMEPCRVFSDQIGAGSQVLAGVIINTGASIGRGTIVNSSAIVEHDVQVGDFCHLAPGSVIGGGARLGANVLLGTNATVLPGISVAAGSVIGAGAVVTHDIASPGTYVGAPARRIASGHAGRFDYPCSEAEL